MTPYLPYQCLLAGLLLLFASTNTSAQAPIADFSVVNGYHLGLGGWGEFYSLNYERVLSSEVKKRDAKAWVGRAGLSAKPGEL